MNVRAPKTRLWLVIVFLSILDIVLMVVYLLASPRPNMNALAVGEESRVDSVNVVIHAPMELDFLSKDEVLQLRSEAALEYPQLLAGDYSPSEAVFGQIVDGRPWWGLVGQVYYGSGNDSIEGASEETRFLLNPYLLVAADFWPMGNMDLASALTFYCTPYDLRWYPRQASAEVTYAAVCVDQWSHAPYFDLIAYNARDFNLKYIYVSYADSFNLTKSQAPEGVYANPQFIHLGGSCGYPGGCNNMSPRTPEIERIKILGFPSSLVIRLWKDEPDSVEQPADMTFIIHIK